MCILRRAQQITRAKLIAMTDPSEVTGWLVEWSNGDESAYEKLIPLVHAELHRLAHHYMSRERTGHTLQTTALVNEAYLKLVDQRRVRWQNRAQFFGICAELMRRILVDYARQQKYAKRGGGAQKISLDEVAEPSQEKATDLMALDEAINFARVICWARRSIHTGSS